MPGLFFSAVASHNLVSAALAAADGMSGVHAGMIVCKDHFYLPGAPGELELLAKYNVLGVEMESSGIYGVAAEFGRQALTVLTVSDHLLDETQNMSAEERETRFQGALKLAVAAALS